MIKRLDHPYVKGSGGGSEGESHLYQYFKKKEGVFRLGRSKKKKSEKGGWGPSLTNLREKEEEERKSISLPIW